jgi:hypothetical protein
LFVVQSRSGPCPFTISNKPSTYICFVAVPKHENGSFLTSPSLSHRDDNVFMLWWLRFLFLRLAHFTGFGL